MPPSNSASPDTLYEPTQVLDVAVSMDPAHWEFLRAQRRNFLQLLAGDCLRAPFPHPYVWCPADVVIGGEPVSSVGVRKKGLFGSVVSDRPSLRIDTDRYVTGQRLHGVEHLTLNNQHQDPSRIVACLAYRCFTTAGLPAPRCSLAHVEVNGEDLGVYANVEPVKKAFLQRVFGTGSGALYEGTVSDFRDGWTATFEPDTDAAVDDQGQTIQSVVSALERGRRHPSVLLEDLDSVIDLRQFVSFWAMEVLIGHVDGYAANANNYYVYAPTPGQPDGKRLRFLPWGIDIAFAGTHPFGDGRPLSVVAATALPAALYAHPDGRALYYQALRRHLDEVWDEQTLLEHTQVLGDLARSRCGDDLIEPAIDAIRAWIQTRRSAINAELAAGTPEWNEQLHASPCLKNIGRLRLDFHAAWGSLGTQDPGTFGDSDWALTLDGQQLDVDHIGTMAGPDHDGGLLLVLGRLPNGALVAACIQIAASALASRTRTPVDWETVIAWLVLAESGDLTDASLAGYLGRGTLTMNHVGTRIGEAIDGHISVHIWGAPPS